MADLHKVNLVLFFTRGLSLTAWDRFGMFEREVALYRALRRHLKGISFVTYGDREDLRYAGKLQGIEILCNRWKLPLNIYSKLIPFLHSKMLRRATIFKSNQTNGAEVALAAAQLCHKRLLARCGYMWSDLAAHGGPERLAEVERARHIESLVFNAAQRVEVTTPAMRDYAVQQYCLPPAKVQVVPNYVLTDLFSPNDANPVSNRLCFVGRLEEEKKPLALVEACDGLDVELIMAGEGPLRVFLTKTAQHLGVNLKLMGNLPHVELPKVLRQSAMFLLVSSHEGHPKTLIEAMSCGLPVIGADSPGIREIIRHGETGYLCGTDPPSIRAAIQTLLANEALRERLGRNARRYVLENFTLERIVPMELDVLKEVIAGVKL